MTVMTVPRPSNPGTELPAAFGGYWTPYARAFYTAETLGVLAQTHDAVFAAIHLQRRLPVNANVGAAELAPFYAQFGVDAKRFTDTFNSFGVDAKINRARQFATRAKIEGTPSLVVKYATLPAHCAPWPGRYSPPKLYWARTPQVRGAPTKYWGTTGSTPGVGTPDSSELVKYSSSPRFSP